VRWNEVRLKATKVSESESDHTRGSTPGRRRGFWLKLVLATALILFGIPASCVARAVLFPPTFDVQSIRTAKAYQDSELLARAWELPAARSFKPKLSYQSNGSKCGPSSLANAFSSLGEDVDEQGILKDTGKCWSGTCFGGLTLDELAELAQRRGTRKVTILRDLDYESFLLELRRSNDPRRRYVVNFQRGLLFAKGTGHHSPIGGYLEREHLVFVLDVNQNFGPWLVDPRRLFDAMNSVDSSSGKKRGLLLIE
jgi:hypothetical protein